MERKNNIVLIENDHIDIDFIIQEVKPFNSCCTAVSLKLIKSTELRDQHPDVILAFYANGISDEINALEIRNKYHPTVPFILIADQMELEDCIEVLKQGVTDIVLKQNISCLSQKIDRALNDFLPAKLNRIPLQSEESLHDRLWRNESKYRSLMENSMDAIFLTKPHGKIFDANVAACRIFQMTPEELFHSEASDIVDRTDARLPLLVAERDQTGRAKGELLFKRKDGSFFPGEISSVIFKDSNGAEMSSITIRDLTADKESKQNLIQKTQELHEALYSLNKILESSLDLIGSFDAEKKIVQINSACKAVTGYEPHELIGKNYFDFIFSEDQERTFNTHQDIINGNPVWLFETSIVHKNGSIVNLLSSAQWDEEDQLIYCTAKDITEKKNLEKAFLQERQRFMDIYEKAPCAIGILKGPTHVIELANPRYLKIIDKKDVIGKTILELLPELTSQGIFELLDAVYATGESFTANEMLVKFDFERTGVLVDRYLNFLYQAHRNHQGTIDGILVFVIDVTEQVVSRKKIEESEKLYRQLIVELPVAAYCYDADGKITIFNKAATDLWGREPEIDKDLYCVFKNVTDENGNYVPKDRVSVAVSIKESRTITGSKAIVENVLGETRFVMTHTVPYIDAAGKVTGGVNVIIDLTESKQNQKILELQNKELLKTNKELDRFVYSVSHDLRSPLTSIQGLVSIIEDETKEVETLEHVGMIKTSVNRLDEFIRKILTYSQNNRTDLHVEIIPIYETITTIVGALKNMPQAKGIQFKIDIQEDATFCSDTARFKTIIENLISNAIKYNNPLKTERCISVQGIANENTIELEISDNGIGIAPEYQDKIFDMFFRISSKSEGSGIGLYIVKDAVEQLNGAIKLKSKINAGTTFQITLKNLLYDRQTT